jgi:tetratricopeptide (TPR) repeat protein
MLLTTKAVLILTALLAGTAASAQTTDAITPLPESAAPKLSCSDALRIYSQAAGGLDKAMPPAPQRPLAASLNASEIAAQKETKIDTTRRRLNDAIRKYGYKSNRAAAAYRVLARDYRDAAQYESAVEALRVAAAIYEGAKSDQRAELGNTQMELGQTLTNKGDRLSALAMYGAAKQTFTDVFGPIIRRWRLLCTISARSISI